MATYFTGFAGNLTSYLTPLKPVAGKQARISRNNEVLGQAHPDIQSQYEEEWLSSTKTVNPDELEDSTPSMPDRVKKHPSPATDSKASKRRQVVQDTSSTSAGDVTKKLTKRKERDDDHGSQHDVAKRKGKAARNSPKRSKKDHAYIEDDMDSGSDLEGSTLIATPGQPRVTHDKEHEDRKRMPPPPTPERSSYTPDPKLVDKDLHRAHKIVRKDAEDPDLSDDELLSERNLVKKTDRRELAFDFDHERAKRYADAVQLPKDSGYWSGYEKEIFYHLAMRGFEPVLPGSWQIDFKTLPQSLFAVEGGEAPIIDPYSLRHFRGSYSFSSLLALGRRVRDRRVMHLRSEPIMQQAIHQFISWALSDAEVHPHQRPNAIPTHVLMTGRPGEKSQEALDRMTRRLHAVASRYHDLYGIYPSVEHDHPTDEEKEDDTRFPVLSGLMICSSVVFMVTLPSNPAHSRPFRTRTDSTSDSPLPSPSKDESGLRLISTFNFSEHGQDVWHSVGIAVVIMTITKYTRKMMEQAGEGAQMWKAAEGSLDSLLRRNSKGEVEDE